MQAPTLPEGLPVPDDESAAHSRRVAAFIREQIAAAGGSITFGVYMHHALYAPGLGYYVSGSPKFGEGGDFVTAPEVSPLFGRVVARQCRDVLASMQAGEILEIGAGSGVLAAELLASLDESGNLPARYRILEASAELRSRQRDLLKARTPQLLDRVEWIDSLPSDFNGVILANEVADALPVERFRVGDEYLEQFVVGVDGDSFAGGWRPASTVLEKAVADLETDLPAGYESELTPGLKPWIADLAGALESGLILLFDYGLSRREFYAPDRSGGWLRCHFRHRAHSEPLILPGIQDITGWVDFTAVAEAGSAAGASIAGYVTQSMFLVHGGVDAEFAELSARDPGAVHALAGGLKILTLPSEMGENFKCIGLTKGEVPVLSALAEADRSGVL